MEKIREEQINISSIKKFQNSSLVKENQTYLQRIALTCMLKIKYKIEKRAIKEAKNGR